jgi:hypothetical protein
MFNQTNTDPDFLLKLFLYLTYFCRTMGIFVALAATTAKNGTNLAMIAGDFYYHNNFLALVSFKMDFLNTEN